MKLLAGLGNPGKKYRSTRHNLGFLVLDEFSRRYGWSISDDKFESFFGIEQLCGEKICVVRPMTYMNCSGDAVAAFCRYYSISPQETCIVHDDLDLAFGQLKLSFKSGDGGHNGIKSITERFGTKEYYRLRVGIGRPLGPIDPADYVLMAFADDEQKALSEVIGRAADAVELFFEKGPTEVMHRFHSS
jgi:PTH1 family peptidyl-tRNA hydrolase